MTDLAIECIFLVMTKNSTFPNKVGLHTCMRRHFGLVEDASRLECKNISIFLNKLVSSCKLINLERRIFRVPDSICCELVCGVCTEHCRIQCTSQQLWDSHVYKYVSR